MAAERPDTTEEPSGPRLRLEAGMVLDDFELVERLHQGGMATLWAVRRAGPVPPDQVGLPLIMKVPRFKGGEDPATIVGFEVEQMIMPRLQGPHVPRYVARGDFTRQPYIVMEHVPGDTLKPRFDQAPLPLREVARIGARIAQALHAVHAQHVVHLDIKPSNIMFRASGEAVLVDFGLSRHDHLPDLLEEEFELTMGTGPYMSPEQVQFVRNDPRSDLFALGVTLYQWLTGRLPYGEIEPYQTARYRRDPEAPSRRRPDVPIWLDHIVLKAVARDPRQRFETAEEFLLALERGASRPLNGPGSTPLMTRDPQALWKIALAVSVLVNLLLVYWLVFLPRR